MFESEINATVNSLKAEETFKGNLFCSKLCCPMVKRHWVIFKLPHWQTQSHPATINQIPSRYQLSPKALVKHEKTNKKNRLLLRIEPWP